MITPRWVATRTQPVAVGDVVTYLAGVLEPPEASGRVYEAGGPDVVQYSTMLRRVAGAPIKGENYYKAEIQTGRIGPVQATPRREFD